MIHWYWQTLLSDHHHFKKKKTKYLMEQFHIIFTDVRFRACAAAVAGIILYTS